MSQFKMPTNSPSTGNLAAAAAQARAQATQAQRTNLRQAQNTQKNAEAGKQEQAAQQGAGKPESGKSSSPSSSSPKTASPAPKAPSAPRPSQAQSTKAPSGKATVKADATSETSKLKIHEAGELDGDALKDSFTDDSSITDIRKFWGSEEGTGSHSAITKDFDLFDPNLPAPEVEQLGGLRGAVHMARLLQHWGAQGKEHPAAVADAATMLMTFQRPEIARSVFRELDRAPITHVYPLQIQLSIMEQSPGFWPNVTRGTVVENKDALKDGERIQAGHSFRLHFPTTMKLKSFALITPGQPGYEFEPVRPGVYRMQVDTPGQWSFALRAEVAGKQVVDTFEVHVHDVGGPSDANTDELG
jgi:hypothetical protein